MSGYTVDNLAGLKAIDVTIFPPPTLRWRKDNAHWYQLVSATGGEVDDGNLIIFPDVQPAAGDVYWGRTASAASLSSIDDIPDVDTSTTAPTDQQPLLFQASTEKWEPGDLPSVTLVSLGLTSINDIPDIDTSTTAPTDQQPLLFQDSTGLWEPGDFPSVGLTSIGDIPDVDTSTTAATDQQALLFQASTGLWEPRDPPSGNGNSGGSGGGGAYSFVEEISISTATNQIQFSGLSGSDFYMIVGEAGSSTNDHMMLSVNGDQATAEYFNQTRGFNGSGASGGTTSLNGFRICYSFSAEPLRSRFVAEIFRGSDGTITHLSRSFNTRTDSTEQMHYYGGYKSNTVADINSIEIFNPSGGDLRVGSRFHLYKLNVATSESVVGGSATIYAEELISTITTTGSQADITFDTIDQTYTDLIFRVRGATTESSDLSQIDIAVNDDTTPSNYYYQTWGASNGSDSAGESESRNGLLMAGANAVDSSYAEITIPVYADSTRSKVIKSEINIYRVDGGNVFAGGRQLWWENTAAITKLVFDPQSGNWADGSIIELYGRKEIAIGSGSPTFEQEVTADAPIGWLKLNETSGAVATDSGSGGNDGSYVGPVILQQPAPLNLPGYAVGLDGSTAYVEWDALTAAIAGDTYSFEWWFNTNNIALQQSLLGVNNSSGGNRMVILINAGDNGSLRIQTTATGTSGPFITSNSWNHLVLVHKTSINLLYLNGSVVYSDIGTATIASTDQISMGQEFDSGTPTDFFNGAVSQWIAYDKVLTPDRILAHYLSAVST